jgi:flagellar biosynthetic protein FliP
LIAAAGTRRVRLWAVAGAVALIPASASRPALAQDININLGQGGGLTERAIQLVALLTVLSLAPSILVMMTSFTRIVAVLSLLRTALCTATAPLNAVFERASGPLRAFMQKNVGEKDLQLFTDLSAEPHPATPADMSLRVLVPAFMISELKRAFEIGFLLFLPFLIIDLVVASVLMSMGMMMLPPVVVSLPFKLIFFVLSTAGAWWPAA